MSKTVSTVLKIASFGIGSFYDVTRVTNGKNVDGPLLVVANHPNSGIDPILVQSIMDRDLRFLAKSTLFKKPVLKTVLRKANALPAYRSQDGSDTTKNQSTFTEVNAALHEGSAVAVFPEGVSHNETNMVKLKTGTARMALAAYNDGVHDLRILPVGLHYFNKERWRSNAAVTVGRVINLSEWIESDELTHDPHSHDAAVALTTLIDERIREVTVNANNEDELEAAQFVAEASGRGLRYGLAFVEEKTETSPAFVRRVELLRKKMDRVGASPKDMTGGTRSGPIRLHVAVDLLTTAVEAPSAFVGAVSYAPAFHATHWIYNLIGKRGAGGASVKIGAGFVTYPVWATILIWTLKKLGMHGAVAFALAFTAWVLHLSSRPIIEDTKRRWKENVFEIQMKYSSKKRQRLAQLRKEYKDLVS